jgi:predicted membrane metal-binding protein
MYLFTGVVLIVVRHVLFLLPFDFLMEQLHCLESVVAMFYNVLFYVFHNLVFFILWVYPFLAFLRLASSRIRFQLIDKPVCTMAVGPERLRGVGAAIVGGAGVAAAVALAAQVEGVAGLGVGCVRAFNTAVCNAGPK